MKITFRSLCAPLVIGALALGFIGGATQAQAQQYKDEYRLSSGLNAPFPWGHGSIKWAELVHERTDGRINIKNYYGFPLVGGDQSKEFTAMRQGVIDMSVSSVLNWVPEIRQLNIFALPFLIPDVETADRILAGNLGDALAKLVEQRGAVILAWGENGYLEVSNSRHAIKSPEDFSGLKMRVRPSPLVQNVFDALGANPVVMSWADAQPALSTRAVDGQENPLSTFMIANMPELGQTHLTLLGSAYEPLAFAVSKTVWDSWSPEDQEIVREAAKEAAAHQLELSRAGMADGTKLDEIRARGVEIHVPTAEEKAAFREATREVYDEWSERIGRDLVELAEQEIAAGN